MGEAALVVLYLDMLKNTGLQDRVFSDHHTTTVYLDLDSSKSLVLNDYSNESNVWSFRRQSDICSKVEKILQ